PNITFGWCGVSFEKVNCRQDHSWCADPTLRTAMIDECLLHRMKLIFTSNTLDRRNIGTVSLRHRNQATVYDLSINDYSASATLAFTAAFFCAGQLKLFA